MKKFTFIALAAAAAALSLSSCQKNEVVSVESQKAEGNFEIYADFTKTAVGDHDFSTKWAANDAINVFHAAKGTTTYGTNDKFTISDAASGKFTGTLTEALYESNDWYALYPYSSYIKTPVNTDGGYLNIGCNYSNTTAQVQTGNSSTAHLAGQFFPLYAKVVNQAKSGKVSLSFKPVLSIVKFHVTNGTAKAIKVSSISLTAQENIIGAFFIGFAGDVPTFADKYVSKTAKLSVKNGEEIAAGASADFYMAIKPFTNTEGSTLTINVDGCEKSSTKAAEFAAGKVKTINFNFDKEEKTLEPGTYVALIQNSGSNYFAMSSTDDGASTKRLKSVDVVYNGGNIFKAADASIIWDVTKSGESYLFKNGTKYLAFDETQTEGKYTNNALMSDSEYKLDVINAGEYYKIKSNSVTERFLSKNTSSKFFAFYGNEGQKVNFTLVPAELVTTPVINPITNPSKVAAAGKTGVSVSYTVSNPVQGKTASATTTANWISNFNYTASSITFDVAENTGAERSATVTVSYDGAESTVDFTVTQSAPSVGATYTKVTSDLSDWSGEYALAAVTTKGKALVWTGVDAGQCHTDSLEINNNSITGDFITITVAKIEGSSDYSIKVNGGSNNGKYISTSSGTLSYSNALKFIDKASPVSFKMNTSGLVEMWQTISATQKTYLLYNSSKGSSNERFRFYKDSNFGGSNYITPSLFKKN